MPALAHATPKSWSSTLQLPKSTFPPRVSSADQAKYLKRCTDDLYAWQRRERPADQNFTLHDGPPYANGSLHIGHALNKILKDIIGRIQLGRGKRVDYVPGWDCHGLPIELKALQYLGGAAVNKDAVGIRKAARELAERTVLEQMKGFRGWAVMGDWSRAWKTMDKSFEMKQLMVFREMVDNGLIYRRNKPVYWSPSSKTALAEAELEYREDHISTATLVKYPLARIPPRLLDEPRVDPRNLSAVVWTTTPWTLPANRAMAVNVAFEYMIVQSEKHGQLLVAQSRLHYVQGLLDEELHVVVESIAGSDLVLQTEYQNLFGRADVPLQPVLPADFVTSAGGSGLVHMAPGHGMDDYEVCSRYGISAFAPVDDEGRFTNHAMVKEPASLSGKDVLTEGNEAVLQYLEKEGRLLARHQYQHKYPYDWRTKLPVIVRATEQWFADVGDIRDHAIQALDNVDFIPSAGRARLESFVRNRSEWCISRQRAWGVPIPALYDSKSGEAVLTYQSVSHIMEVVEERGIDAWWTDNQYEPAWIPHGLRNNMGSSKFRRGTDTMDVWFDSGTSWTQIAATASPSSQSPADVYIEGTDQHRGWFQSSLMTYVAYQNSNPSSSNPTAPFRRLITHGFTLDQDGKKMSKSVGNVISPTEIMDGTLLAPLRQKKGKGKGREAGEPVYDAMGPDALRLWVASSDYTNDVIIGSQLLKSVNASLHKCRVTIKLLLGALEDFDPATLVEYNQLRSIDKIALLQLSKLNEICLDTFEQLEFYKAVNAINKWVNLDFSAFYIESIKDRLYTDAPASQSRRAAQTVLYHIYCHLQCLLAPITPILVEEAWEHTPHLIKAQDLHPLKRIYPKPPVQWSSDIIEADLPDLLSANTAVKTAQERARVKKEMGSSLQSFVYISLPRQSERAWERFSEYAAELADLFVVSAATFGVDGITSEVLSAKWRYSEEFNLMDGQQAVAYVYPPTLGKCVRCWRYTVLKDPSHGESLCDRCEEAVDLSSPASK